MRNRWRLLLSHAIVVLCIASVLLALVPLALVLFYVLTQGVTSLNWAFFTPHAGPGWRDWRRYGQLHSRLADGDRVGRAGRPCRSA